jgi:hypothetical protein
MAPRPPISKADYSPWTRRPHYERRLRYGSESLVPTTNIATAAEFRHGHYAISALWSGPNTPLPVDRRGDLCGSPLSELSSLRPGMKLKSTSLRSELIFASGA